MIRSMCLCVHVFVCVSTRVRVGMGMCVAIIPQATQAVTKKNAFGHTHTQTHSSHQNNIFSHFFQECVQLFLNMCRCAHFDIHTHYLGAKLTTNMSF